MAADRQLCRNSSGSESPEEVTRMEIERPEVSADGDSLQSGIKETSNLRRSNSAPMFNGPNMGDESPVFQPINDRPRVRRFSTHIIGSPKPPSSSKGTSLRVNQIRHEESMDIVSRETEGERGIQSAFQMSQSWDDMHLDASIKTLRTSQGNKPRFSDPLSIMPPAFPLSSSPSPTRATGKQCFSPSTQIYRNNSMSPSPIPSPTRSTVTRRSMSPVLRPSNLGMGVKRKAGDHEMDTTPSKRIFLSSPSHPSSTASISSISSDDSSPLQQRATTESNNVNNSMLSSPSHFQFSSSSSNSV
ncbi:hypothetical protein BSL78_03528 [Apostichopus japonicus]|uniref:Protein FAM122A n=1 Tax=Stichopus japonicus TaxID=307972 RepID=A0A2G8LH44_STIJA|nr:hypothetical protein BSL78_03528 [Apostichopus japonicus]